LADDGRADGCGSLTTAASPGHVLAARSARRPRSRLAAQRVASLRLSPNCGSARAPGPLRLCPSPSALSSPGWHRLRPAFAGGRMAPDRWSCASAVAGVIFRGVEADACADRWVFERGCPSGQLTRVGGSGAQTASPGRRGGRWRGTQAEGPRGSRAAEGTIRVATKELGVARSSDEASTCHGDAAVVRDPQPSAPPSSADDASRPAFSRRGMERVSTEVSRGPSGA